MSIILIADIPLWLMSESPQRATVMSTAVVTRTASSTTTATTSTPPPPHTHTHTHAHTQLSLALCWCKSQDGESNFLRVSFHEFFHDTASVLQQVGFGGGTVLDGSCFASIEFVESTVDMD